MGSVGPLHLPVLPAAGCLPTSQKTFSPPPHRCPPTLYTNQPFRICPTTRYICYIVAFFCRLYSVPSLPPTSNRAMPHCGMFVKVDKAIKMAPYGRAGSGLPMPCTVPRLPGLIHCVQLLTLLLPLAQWSDYNKAPLCRLPVIIPSSPTCPPTSSSPHSLIRFKSAPEPLNVFVYKIYLPHSLPPDLLTTTQFPVYQSEPPTTFSPATVKPVSQPFCLSIRV